MIVEEIVFIEKSFPKRKIPKMKKPHAKNAVVTSTGH
jgi:hypothetical protein